MSLLNKEYEYCTNGISEESLLYKLRLPFVSTLY